jgi:hypothetical protein
LEKIQEIAREYFENDPSFRALIECLHSPRFVAAWQIFASSPEIEDIFEWMTSHGVNLSSGLKMFAEEVERRPSRYSIHHRLANGYSVTAFTEEVKALIDFEALDDKIDELLDNGDDFTHLYLILSVTQEPIEKVFEDPEIKRVLGILKTHGVEVDRIQEFVYKTLRFD